METEVMRGALKWAADLMAIPDWCQLGVAWLTSENRRGNRSYSECELELDWDIVASTMKMHSADERTHPKKT